MSDNLSILSLWLKAAVQPAVILSFLALIFNFSVGVVYWRKNKRLYNERQNEIRDYELRYETYKKLVLEHYATYLQFPMKIEQILNELEVFCMGETFLTDIQRKQKIEESIGENDNIYETFCSNILVLSRGYDQEFFKEITKIIEELYDESTTIIASYQHENIQSIRNTLRAKFEQSQEKYFKNIIALIGLSIK